MSKSLQDQLLALGLANEKTKKTRKLSKRAPGKVRQKLGAGSSPKQGQGRAKQAAEGKMSLNRVYALRRQEEKKQADMARKRKQADRLAPRVMTRNPRWNCSGALDQ